MSAIVAQVEGRQVRLTSLTRVMYPSMRITKTRSSTTTRLSGRRSSGRPSGRPVTRIRFPHGVGGQSFFEKNAPDGIPGGSLRSSSTPSGTRCSTKSPRSSGRRRTTPGIAHAAVARARQRGQTGGRPGPWSWFWTDAVLGGSRCWWLTTSPPTASPARRSQAVRKECNWRAVPGSYACVP